MTFAQLLSLPITIFHRSTSLSRDEYGSEVPAESAVDTVGELQQQSRSEPANQDELSETTWLLILPFGTTLATGDVVVAGGHRYEVIGDPWPARNPRTGAGSHLEATLRRTAGSEDVGS